MSVYNCSCPLFLHYCLSWHDHSVSSLWCIVLRSFFVTLHRFDFWSTLSYLHGMACTIVRSITARHKVTVRPYITCRAYPVQLTEQSLLTSSSSDMFIHKPTWLLWRVFSRAAIHHHIVSATALIHRTARPSISAMSSLLGISPKCGQLVMIWFRSHVAAPHIQCLFSR